MYGMRVHRAVRAAGVAITGCTVHVVSGDYDSGPILAQQAVAVLPLDDAEAIAQRVMAAERELYPAVIRAVLDGGITYLDDRAYRPSL